MEEQNFYAERKQKKSTKPNGEVSQHRDSGYSTSNDPSESPSSPKDSEDKARFLDRSKERITTRQSGWQDEPSSPTVDKDQAKPKGKKRASSDEGFEDERSLKKAKMSSEEKDTPRMKKAHRLRRPFQAPAEDGSDAEADIAPSSPEPQLDTKVKSEKELTQKDKNSTDNETDQRQTATDSYPSSEEDTPADTTKKLNKRNSRSSEDEEDLDEASIKKQKTGEKDKQHGAKVPASNKTIITEAEKVKGVSYIPLGDGKYQLRKSAQAKPKTKQPSPSSNTIDPTKFIS